MDGLTEIRMRRQEMLTAPGSPHLWAIVSEAALHQQVGGADTLAMDADGYRMRVGVPMFPVVDVSSWGFGGYEVAGSEEKLWLVEPATGELWLFKPVTRHSDWEQRRLDPQQGENWAEKIAAEAARLLGVPAARVEMASRDGVAGSISLNLRPGGWEMQPGTVLLSAIVPEFDPTPQGGHVGHTLANIRQVLRGYAVPMGWSGLPKGFDAFDVFVGYLLLDAWIANRDRHSENWAVLRSLTSADAGCLSPSYDHASSLGFNQTQARLEQILGEPGRVEWFARRGTAWRFEGCKKMTLVDFALKAMHTASAGTADYWLGKLAATDKQTWTAMVEGVREMSAPARRFVVELLEINRRRLLDA